MANSLRKKSAWVRWWLIPSGTFFVTFFSMLIIGLNQLLQVISQSSPSVSTPSAAAPSATITNFNWFSPQIILVGLVVGLGFFAFQWYMGYKRMTYDPTWALKFEDQFWSESIKKDRLLAAETILNNYLSLGNISDETRRKELAKIDNVLDFLETLGFYEHGYQISPEVIHHHFYYWIRGYWFASKRYVEAWRSKPKERRRWERLEELFVTTRDVELQGTKRSPEEEILVDDEIKEFLNEEIDECGDDPKPVV